MFANDNVCVETLRYLPLAPCSLRLLMTMFVLKHHIIYADTFAIYRLLMTMFVLKRS